MDTNRFEALKSKRFQEGLTDDEAAELGRMFAEEQSQPYQSAEDYRRQQAGETGRVLEDRPSDAEAELEGKPEVVKDEAEGRLPPPEDLPQQSPKPIGARTQETREG